MMPAGEQQLYSLVKALGSASKEERDGAERQYEQEWISKPGVLFPGLLELIATSDSQLLKSIGAVLLRKAIMREAVNPATGEDHGHLWTTMDGTLQEQCRAGLLQLFQRETNSDVQHRLGDAIAEVARIQAEYGEWPELLGLLFSAAQPGSSEAFLMSLLRVLGAVPEVIENRLQNLGDLALVLQACLNQPSGKVRLEAIRAMVSVIYVLGDEEEGDARAASQVQKAFQPIVNVSGQIVASLGDEPELQSEALLSLIDLVTSSPKLFKEASGPLAGLMLQLVANPEADEDVRKGGLELLLTVVECVKRARKDGALVGQVLELLVRLVAEVEEDQGEFLGREPDEDDICEAEIISQYAEQGLDRLSMDLGGKALMPHMFRILPRLLQSSSWRERYAGLRTLASVAEGCLDVLEDGLDGVLGLIWPSFQDPVPRVQYAACHALGQLCTDFDGAIQEAASEKALSALVGVLVTSQQPRVQTHAAAALINFAEGVQPDKVAPFLDELLSRLISLLNAPGTVMYLQSQLMTTLGAFSSAVGTAFTRYYGTIIPLLMGCFTAACDPADKARRQLQCRALEAITLIFYALGREHIQQPDLDALVQHMVALQQAELAEDDDMLSFLSTAWFRLCHILGEGIAPFLPLLIPRLLQQAGQKADLAALDMDESLDAYDQADWEFATVRGKRLGIRTATLDSKLDALSDLNGYVEALQAAYLPMASATVDTALPLLSFSLHEGIQATASELLANLLPLMHAADPSATAQYISTTAQALLKSWDPEHFNLDYTYAALDALADLMPVLLPVLGPAFLQAAFAALPGLLQSIVDSIQAKLTAEADDDDDGEEDEDDMDDCEDEEELMYALSRFMAALFRAYGQAIAPHLEDLVVFCTRSVTTKQTSASMKHACLCILDDMLHWAGPEGTAAHAGPITGALAAGIGAGDDTDVRQAALYGVGMAAEYGGPIYRPFLEAVLPGALVPLLQAPNARAPSQREVTDNAASATGRILLALPHLAGNASVLSAWLRAFPIVSDEDEILPAYTALLHLVRAGAVSRGPSLAEAIRPALALAKDPFAGQPALRAELTALSQ